MATSFRDFIEAVRAATDIARIIGADVDLKPSGKMLKGLSPFHPEKTPSFVVWPDTQTWHDFSGGGSLGGDVFAYVQEREHVGFKEALFALAERAGLQRPDQDEKIYEHELARLVERRDVERLLTQVAFHYHQVLPSRVRETWYRDHYGFTDVTIDELQLGWAAGHLFEHFVNDLGATRELALATGLFVVVQDGRVEDFFQDRLVFPYWKGGQVAYFIARATEHTGDEPWEQAKYKKLLTRSERHDYVSPSVRNETFYNEDAARGADELLITEGITDCISARQAGIPCISPATTRFRAQDLPKLLALTRGAKRVIVCNDAEENGAGLAGAMETAVALSREGRDVRIALLPRPDGTEKIDVNEFLKAHPPEAFRALLDAARRPPEVLLEAIPADTPALDLAPLLRPALEMIAARPPLEQDAYVDIIAARFGVTRRAVRSMLNACLREAKEKAARAKAAAKARDAIDQAAEDGGNAASGEGAPGGATGDSIRGEIYEDADHYYVVGFEDTVEVISSFQVEPTERIRLEDGEVIVGHVTTDQGRIYRGVRFPPSAWLSKRGLLATFPTTDMQWTGTDDQVQGLLRILARRPVPVRRGTRTLGYIETPDGPRWVAEDLVLGPDGPRSGEDIVFIPNGSTFPGRVRYPAAEAAACRELAGRILPDLLELNEPAVVLPILGWFFAAPFKPRVLDLLGHFPILMVWGTAGSGKTTIVKEIFWRLFGVGSTDPFSATETEFALIKLLASTNGVPIFLDEYRPGDMPRFRLNSLHRFLRRLYGGEVEERGRPDLSVTSYRLAAPVCLAGESRPDDAALVDRMVAVTPDKNRLRAHPEHVEVYERLRALDLELLAAPYVQFTLGRDTRADLEAAVRICDRVLATIPGGEGISTRCRDNLRVVVLGLSMFEAFARELGVTGLPELDLESALAASIADLMDGEQGAKNPLDLFLETCSVLAYTGTLIEGRDYAVVNGLVCLHLRACWELYLEHRRKTGQFEEASGLRALRRLLRENLERGGYVKDLGKTISMGDRRPRTVAIDLEQAGQFLDVDEFPQGMNRTWGGYRGPIEDWPGRN